MNIQLPYFDQISRRLLFLVNFGVITACGGAADSATGPATAAIASVTITSPQNAVVVGDTLRMTAVAKTASGVPVSTATFSWASSAPSVMSVDNTGLVGALTAGSATITATAGSITGTTSPIQVKSPGPVIALFRADRYTVEVGRPLTFIWSVSDAAKSPVTCTINIDNAGPAEVSYPNCADSSLASVTYPTAGTYTALLTATNAQGATATDTVSIVVGKAGTLSTGMDASLVLSAFGFNKTGGSGVYNYPAGMGSDGTRFFLADRNNNRVLVWNTLPTSNVPPDYVLGQTNFTSNDPGSGLANMNWPTSIAVAGGRLVVADANNDRVLVWNTIPTTSGAAADFALSNSAILQWPWGIWTDGTKLAVSSTRISKILIWNLFPSSGSVSPDVILTAAGTPRTITSNGVDFIVGDHNPPGQSATGNYFWNTFPTRNEPPSFFRTMPENNNGWMTGDFTSDGKLILFGSYAWIWNTPPASAGDAPNLTLRGNAQGTLFRGGDGADLKVFGGHLYISLTGGNRIVGYNSIPTTDREPDFVIGAPTTATNTRLTNFIISNPVPASDGRHLFVTSDGDQELYIWRKIPTFSGTAPDATLSLNTAQLNFQPWDNTLFGDVFMAAGERTIAIWRTLPLNGESPTTVLQNSVGGVTFTKIMGIAYDGRNTFVLDETSSGAKIYVWAGIPTAASSPTYTLDAPASTTRLSSDGTYLAFAALETGRVYIYTISQLPGGTPALVGGGLQHVQLNLPQDVLIAGGRVFIADASNNRVAVWNSISSALANALPDAYLGKTDPFDSTPRIGKNQLFLPGAIAYDGTHVWVGEFKFSGRLVAYPLP